MELLELFVVQFAPLTVGESTLNSDSGICITKIKTLFKHTKALTSLQIRKIVS